MFDPTPPPFGDVTRRWTQLEDQVRAREVDRLLGAGCQAGHLSHVARPGRDLGGCYLRLVTAGIDGDEVAVAWLATTHRPLLVSRGLALFEHDPDGELTSNEVTGPVNQCEHCGAWGPIDKSIRMPRAVRWWTS